VLGAGAVRLVRIELGSGRLLGSSIERRLNARGISSADGVVVGSGGAVAFEGGALEPLWQAPGLRADAALANEDLAVAHGRILGVARSGVAFCFEEGA
jgi:hypothetical protein